MRSLPDSAIDISGIGTEAHNISVSNPLSVLIRGARELNMPRLEREARLLAERVADERFYLACLGQFKRGKSSLLNALVGEPVLPTGVLPVTAIVTILRYGSPPRAVVHFENGSEQQLLQLAAVSDYVTEQQNPGNIKGVTAVEIWLPSRLLAAGMCLADTPGIGSVNVGNTAVTKAFLPHIDAALIVLGAEPPLSGEELELIEAAASQVDKLIFVLNKVDRMSAREAAEAAAFARRVLADRLRIEPTVIYQTSATEWLEAKTPTRDAAALAAELERLASECGPRLVALAHRRGIQRLSTALIGEIDRRRASLTSPLDEFRSRSAELRTIIADAERSLSDLAYLFKAEQDSVNRRCAERRDSFLADAIPAARREFRKAVLRTSDSRGARLYDRATEIAQEISRRLLTQWLEEERPAAEAMTAIRRAGSLRWQTSSSAGLRNHPGRSSATCRRKWAQRLASVLEVISTSESISDFRARRLSNGSPAALCLAHASLTGWSARLWPIWIRF